FGITARLFVALAAALCAFGGLVALAMEYVFPRLNESEQVVILTTKNLMRLIDEETVKLQEENPDITPQEVHKKIREKYGKQIEEGSVYRAASNFVRYLLMTVVLLFVLIGLVYARTFTKPLRQLNESARRVANLDFTAKTDFGDRNDEIGQLSKNLNLTNDRLKEALDELKEKNTSLTKELEHEKNLESRRKQFLSDVSHELKTPLAIIGGYAEALGMGVKSQEKAKHYCAVIGEETDKMARLLSELMELSRYEAETFAFNPRRFDIGEMLTGIGKKYAEIFAKNGIRYIADIAGGAVSADPDRLEQVVSNFLNNAVSHAGGEKVIYVRQRGGKSNAQFTMHNAQLSDKSNAECRFSIINSGEPIAQEDIDNIWLAFYRADKARGRDEGRFGLGLSIVRALLERHGAEYGARNVEGVTVKDAGGQEVTIKAGVEFWFKI
ncbi:MAG: HAMP domain-containing protein, partial [Clostridiales bacterium]|nr:HAMP domain-containing protein [Clostridiales bacterium]